MRVHAARLKPAVDGCGRRAEKSESGVFWACPRWPLDATAVLGDLLTFHSERITDEAYLRTANEHRSLVLLGRLVGHWPRPGVAAATHLAYTLDRDPRAEAQNVLIPRGTHSHSMPASADEESLTFETGRDLVARGDLNELKVRRRPSDQVLAPLRSDLDGVKTPERLVTRLTEPVARLGEAQVLAAPYEDMAEWFEQLEAVLTELAEQALRLAPAQTNQLYRVEVHEGGEAKDATFKWSRENGSVVLPVDELDGTWVQLASLGHDDKLDLDIGDHVEFVDTAYASRLEPLPLLRVEELDLPGRRVRLSAEPAPSVGRLAHLNPYLRAGTTAAASSARTAAPKLRGGAVPVAEGEWLPLEDGVEVYFARGGSYRTGDHRLVPARTATGGVEWPVDPARRPLLQGPAGIARHFAPPALIKGEGSAVDLRLAFGPLASSMPAADEATLAAEEQARREELAAEDPSRGRSQTTAEAEAAVEGDN
nr:DUF6519 domain-containing protein [Streptomyces viridochromogenes]